MDKAVRLEVRSRLRQRETGSRALRKAIHESSGMDRWYAWQEKRSFGRETRHLLLAYAFLRGVPYARAEPKCGDTNGPSILDIVAVAGTHGPASVDAVRAWLDGTPLPQAVAAE